MPTLSQFDGIVVSMDYHDAPPPHIHACCGECEAIVEIPSMTLQKGYLPPHQLGVELVVDWATEHVDELLENWRKAQKGMQLHPVAPLKPGEWSL